MGCDPRKTIIAAAQVEYLNTTQALTNRTHTHMQRRRSLSKRRRYSPMHCVRVSTTISALCGVQASRGRGESPEHYATERRGSGICVSKYRRNYL